uniref:Small lysine rich protein 1 n=1 Tax=Equus caballus TaxID=9796 RepID=A0A9L0SAX4_HORSE
MRSSMTSPRPASERSSAHRGRPAPRPAPPPPSTARRRPSPGPAPGRPNLDAPARSGALRSQPAAAASGKRPSQRRGQQGARRTFAGRQCRCKGACRGGPARPNVWTPGAVSRQRPGKEKRGTGRGKSHGKKQKKPEVDILSPAAMLNLYYIAHNVADCLQLRGFRWPGAPKAKKGKAKT